MKLVEIALRSRGRGIKEREEVNQSKMFCKHFINDTMLPCTAILH
jgi:hypothetical protein